MFRSIFNLLPSFAGILLATLAFAFLFMKVLDERLKDNRIARWLLAIVLWRYWPKCIHFGFGSKA